MLRRSVDAELIDTADGSHSLRSKAFDVDYHSKHGAIQESQHVFIEAGLNYRLPELEQVRVFELGFGTGLNAFLTWQAAQTHEKSIYYESVEAFPITLTQAKQLNYPAQLALATHRFEQLHEAPWGQTVDFDTHFSLHKLHEKAETAALSGAFDVVYFDAFAPDSQPELWGAELLQKIYNALSPDGVLVTYCAKGVVKRTLKSIGFTIEGIPGPPGKREMTRAHKGQVKTVSE